MRFEQLRCAGNWGDPCLSFSDEDSEENPASEIPSTTPKAYREYFGFIVRVLEVKIS